MSLSYLYPGHAEALLAREEINSIVLRSILVSL
jgi:hypothetical protein